MKKLFLIIQCSCALQAIGVDDFFIKFSNKHYKKERERKSLAYIAKMIKKNCSDDNIRYQKALRTLATMR